jgi:hypothetical protein
MANYGRFSDNPQTEWVTDSGGPDRDMKLLREFWYEDPNGKRWTAPKGNTINGASIPRPLWSTVGSPYTDDYRNASIVHDVACDQANTPDKREAADKMFYLFRLSCRRMLHTSSPAVVSRRAARRLGLGYWRLPALVEP